MSRAQVQWFAIGDRVSKYELQKRLGAGRSAQVFLARDTVLNRRVALKLFRPSTSIDRVEREVRLLSRLDHEGIARLLEFETGTSSHPLIALEWVEGVSWEESALSSEESIESRVRSVIQACQAIQHAHQRGILHRDLKPSNLMMDIENNTRVLDFGSAIDEEGDRSQLEGTIRYMSPEALEDHHQIDVRSDVFSLAVCAYQRLAHHHPISDRQDSHASWPEPLKRSPIPPLPLPSGASPDLQLVMRKALSLDKNQRYSSMAAFGDDLERILQHQPISARPPNRLYVAGRFLRRHRLPCTLAALLILALLFVLALTFRTGAIAQSDATTAKREAHRARLVSKRLQRLSDDRRLHDLKGRMSELWPAWPKNQDGLIKWLQEANELGSRMPIHKLMMWKLKRPDRSSEIEAMILRQEAKPVSSETLESFLIELSTDSPREPVPWSSTEAQWQHRVLESLVHQESALPSWIQDVQGRLETVERRARLHKQWASLWQQCRANIADPIQSPLYQGMDLKPQMGIRPLQKMPQSGLWEFLVEGSGTLPVFNESRGTWDLTVDFGVVLVLCPPSGPSQPAFFISKYELTAAQWERLYGEKPGRYIDTESRELMDLHPVQRITAKNAQHRLLEQGMRLPTLSEWTYAARAGTKGDWYCGTEDQLVHHANFCDESYSKFPGGHGRVPESWNDGFAYHAPVGRLLPNPFGLHDIHGNVYEWCQEPSSESPYYARGGAYNSYAKEATIDAQYPSHPDSSSDLVGVRGVRDVDEDDSYSEKRR